MNFEEKARKIVKDRLDCNDETMEMVGPKIWVETIATALSEAYEQGLKVGRAEAWELEKALEFYANEMSYSTDDYRGVSGEMIHRCVLYSDSEERNDVYSFAGRRARAALKKWRGKEKT